MQGRQLINLGLPFGNAFPRFLNVTQIQWFLFILISFNFWMVRCPCRPREAIFFTSKRFGKEALPWIPV